VKRTTAADLLPLTPLSIAILLALVDEARHGYGIIKALERDTDGRIVPGAGTLYAALQRMVDNRLIVESTKALGDDDDQRRRYYAITPFGRDVARAELMRMARLIDRESARTLLPDLRLTFRGTAK
jgi:DNA-binding PadR family transcriptional regulator